MSSIAQDRRRLHAAAFAGASEAILVVDEGSGAVLHANPAAAGLTGRSLEDLEHGSISQILEAADGGDLWARLRDAGTGGGPPVVRLDVTLPAGRNRPVLARARRLAEDGGGVLLVYLSPHDPEHAALAAALDDANRQVLQARRASEEKNRFFAGMTHELRTPLNAVLGLADLLTAMDLPADAGEVVTMIDRSGRVLLRLINDLLDLSKLEAGRLDVVHEPFDLSEVLGGLSDIFSVQCRAKGLGFALRVDDALPARLVGDAGRLRQVLANLLDNALKFTSAGQVTCEAGPAPPREGDAPGLIRVGFRVTDTGIGIEPQQQRGLFEPYTQAASDTARKYGGTGLGLTICRMLVELMDGEIDVTSEAGSGSAFRFDVLLARAPAPAVPAEQDARGAVDAGPPQRLLLVEDNKINQRVALGLLDKLGHTTRTADDGASALAALADEDFDLVFMDVQLPDLSGLEVTRRLRAGDAGERNRAAPVVAMTAHATRQDRQTCLDAGMDDYIAKPIGTDRIVEAMRRVRSGRQDGAVPACDLRLLMDEMEGDEALAREILDIFLDDARARVAVLAAAVQRYDFDAVCSEAKTLEGAALNVHARGVVTLLVELMAAARNKEEEYASSLLEELREQIEAVAAAV
jgi:signal transduction histidine kinase/DNA-binding response OmpR family regulator